MLPTLLFVMAGLADGPDRTTVDAFAAAPIGEEEAIGPVVRVWPRGRLDRYLCDHRSCAHGLALGGDQTVTQAEGAQAGGMSGMALGPGRGVGKTLRHDIGPIGGEDRGDGRVADLFQALCDVPAQSRVEFFTKDPDSGPFLGGVLLVPPIGLPYRLPLGQNP